MVLSLRILLALTGKLPHYSVDSWLNLTSLLAVSVLGSRLNGRFNSITGEHRLFEKRGTSQYYLLHFGMPGPSEDKEAPQYYKLGRLQILLSPKCKTLACHFKNTGFTKDLFRN